MVVVGAKVPEVPVMVIVPLPVAAEELAVSISVLFEAVLAGLNDAVTPLGNPEAAKFTLPEKPRAGTTLIVIEPLSACCKVTAPGDDESVNDGGGAWKLDCAPAPPQLRVINKDDSVTMRAALSLAGGATLDVLPVEPMNILNAGSARSPVARLREIDNSLGR